MKKLILFTLILASISYSCSKEDDWGGKLSGSWEVVEALQYASCSSYDDIRSLFPYKSISFNNDNSVQIIDNNNISYEGSWNYFTTSSSITSEDANGNPLLLTTHFDNIEFSWDSPNDYFTVSTIVEIDNNLLILKNPHQGGDLKIHFSKIQ